MSAIVEPEITLLELVEALSKDAKTDEEIAETVCAMVSSHRVRLIGQFDGRHVNARPAAASIPVRRLSHAA